MPIDTSIYGQIKPIQIDGPLDTYAKVAQFKQMQNQNQLADLMFSEKEQASTEQNALRGLLSDRSNYDERGNLMRAALPKIGAVAPGQYGDYQKQVATQEKTAIEAKKAQLEESLKRFEVSGQIMAGVKDQATWTLARQQAAQLLGPEAAAQMPEAYDPALVEQKRMQALTVKDQLDQKWKALDYKLNTDKFSYQQTNDEKNRAVTIQGQRMADARGREANDLKRQEVASGGKPPAGYRYKADGNLEAIPGGPADIKAGAEGAKKTSDAMDVLGLLDEVDAILPKATGGYVGMGADMVASGAGYSTEGAKATAQLKALQGALIGKMPKMSGPQSDKDVLLYRDMAGQVADASIPVAQRQAASRMIRKLNEKYAGMPEGSSIKNRPQQIKSDADYNALPSGAEFIDPNGKLRRKP